MQNAFTENAALLGQPKLSLGDYVSLSIATCGGIGYLPIVPATWGSLFGIGVYLALDAATEKIILQTAGLFSEISLEALKTSLNAFVLLGIFLIGLRAATNAEKITGKKDPKIVVIDELVGQLITFSFIPAKMGFGALILGFFVFRFFDIWKLYPADVLESLPSGLGAMADDVMAGIYAGASMSLLCTIYLMFFNL